MPHLIGNENIITLKTLYFLIVNILLFLITFTGFGFEVDAATVGAVTFTAVFKLAVDEGASSMLIFLACKSVRSFFLV